MKLFKICLMVVVGVLCSSSLLAAEKNKDTIYPVKDCGVKGDREGFSIVGFNNYPPFSWLEMDDGQERFRGFVPDFVRRTLNNMNIEVIKERPFDDYAKIQKALLHGKVDLSFVGHYIDETKSGQDYVYPAYFGNPLIVVSRASKRINVKDASGLKGLKGVIRREEEIESLIAPILPTDTKLEVVDKTEEAFRKLLSGDADFMITSPYAADAEAKRFKIKDKLYFGTQALRHIKYFVSFSKMSPCRKYKKAFTEQFEPQIKDKAEIEKKLLEYIQIWADKYADEPPLQYTPADGE